MLQVPSLQGLLLYFAILVAMMMSGDMPRGSNVATSLCTVSNAKWDLPYFCMFWLQYKNVLETVSTRNVF